MIHHEIRKRQSLNVLLTTISLILLMLFQESFALQQDKKAPISIKADSIQINRKLGINLYQGHVKLIQGSTHLSGDKVYVLNNTKKEITEIISIGNPETLAHYKTQPKKNDKIFDAFAMTIKYFPQEKMAFLIEQAIAQQGKNTFRGPFITYNMNTQIITSLPTQTKNTLNDTLQTSILIDPNQHPLF